MPLTTAVGRGLGHQVVEGRKVGVALKRRLLLLTRVLVARLLLRQIGLGHLAGLGKLIVTVEELSHLLCHYEWKEEGERR